MVYRPGHEAVRILVMDQPARKPNNTFDFYLDDSFIGGSDHVFVDSELRAWKPNYKERETLMLRMAVNLSLKEMNLNRPIGIGK